MSLQRKLNVKIFLMFIVAENTGSVNILKKRRVFWYIDGYTIIESGINCNVVQTRISGIELSSVILSQINYCRKLNCEDKIMTI